MKLLIGGDLVPTRTNVSLFQNAEVNSLLGKELSDFLASADYRLFNLEVPLTDISTPIGKCGPNLIAPTTTISGIKSIGADFVTLANNHIMDQGEQGLFSTMRILQENGIAYVGAGTNLQAAQRPFVLEHCGHRIGVYACVEHEFSVADIDRPGANPFDPLECFDHIEELKKQVDYVIVLYHGGKEHYRYPSPMLQKICRKIVDKGADLVVCQHSHCVGCEEKYLNGTIVYGQGNFLFDRSDNIFWQTSLLIELEIKDEVRLIYHPLKKQGNVVRLAQGEEAMKILSDFHNRNAEIKTAGFLDSKFEAFSKELFWDYLGAFHGKRTKKIWFRIINKLSGYQFAKWYLCRQYDKQALLRIRNYIECESHSEAFLFSQKK